MLFEFANENFIISFKSLYRFCGHTSREKSVLLPKRKETNKIKKTTKQIKIVITTEMNSSNSRNIPMIIVVLQFVIRFRKFGS